jgi:hypothetical protein
MKRPILLAALLAASSAMVQPAQAQEEHTGSMLRMFDISTPSAGKVNFIGTGTANFNQSIGTNNNFNVGSSTALGVNASASSTEDYTAEGNADLQLAGTSRLQQTIGTATSAFNVATANESSSTAAHTSAFEVANSQYEHGSAWTEDYSSNLQTEGGWEFRAANHQDASQGEGWYTDSAAAGETSFIASTNATQADDWEDFSRGDWKSGWDSIYNETYSESYESAVSASSTEAVNTDQSGIISGIFSTVDYGSATSEVTASDTTGMQTAATEAAASHIVYDSSAAEGEQYSIATETQDVNGVATEVEVGNYANQTMTQEEMEAAYDREYTKSFNAQFSSAAGLMRSSDSTVTVTGLGVIADVNASENSSFKASAKLLDGAERDGNGNGNASSGANLATSSYANQSNSSTASAFMQAFSGGLPDEAGQTTIQKVNPIYATPGDTTSAITGYDIETSVVRDPLVTTGTYTLDDADTGAVSQ